MQQQLKLQAACASPAARCRAYPARLACLAVAPRVRQLVTAPRRQAAPRRAALRCRAEAAAAAEPKFEPQVAVVLGTQWGDEGKGKLVDILAQTYEIVARAQVLSSAGWGFGVWHCRHLAVLIAVQCASAAAAAPAGAGADGGASLCAADDAAVVPPTATAAIPQRLTPPPFPPTAGWCHSASHTTYFHSSYTHPHPPTTHIHERRTVPLQGTPSTATGVPSTTPPTHPPTHAGWCQCRPHHLRRGGQQVQAAPAAQRRAQPQGHLRGGQWRGRAPTLPVCGAEGHEGGLPRGWLHRSLAS